MNKRPKYLITIDTEPDCDPQWNRRVPESFRSVTEGIPQYLRPIWNKHQVQPIYFVSPQVLRNDGACAVLRYEISQGAIIGAHLHSEFMEPAQTLFSNSGLPSDEYPSNLPAEIEHQKIGNLKTLIQKRLNYTPVWYRAARYGARLETISALRDHGFLYDSSITPEIDWTPQGGPDHSHAPLHPYWISPHNLYQSVPQDQSLGILEFPITIHQKRLGILGGLLPNSWLFYNWLRPSHMSVWEQRRLIRRLAGPDTTFTLLFHSMEILINQSPYVRNAWMQRRFLHNLDQIVGMLVQL